MLFGSKVNYLSKNKRALSKYSVGSQEPGLAFDFIDNVYQKDQNKTVNFDGAITHVRSGNATMTDGYGPELIDNPSFSDTSFWTTTATSPATSTIANGVATIVSPAGEGATCQADILTVGKVYEVTVKVKVRSGSCKVQLGSAATANGTKFISSSGNYTFVRENDGTDGLLFLARSGACDVDFDDISVREIPVIKWAPHNLIPNSEDFTAVTYSKNDVTVTANYGTAPDGTNTATRLQETGANAYLVRGTLTDGHKKGIWARATSGTGTVNIGSYYTVTGALVTLTEEWQLIQRDVDHSESAGTTGQNLYCVDFRAGTLTDIMVWGAHSFRQDLGGMVDNPDQPLSRASYVPTTTAAKYLPRIGHHVYNGSAWANEGLLAESEARTNEFTYSNDFTNAAWFGINTGTLALDAVGPDGVDNSAATLIDNNAGGTGTVLIQESVTVSTSTAYTFSVYAKKDQANGIMLYHANFTTPANNGWIFNLEDGTITQYLATPASTATIENVGNGWYRCAITFTTDAADTVGDCRIYVADGSNIAPDLDGTSSVLIYGAQFEAGSTPSSLIPTSGSSVTRAAESFTIPSANLPWPDPVYTGSELVTNGTFDTDISGWTDGSSGTGSISYQSGEALLTSVDSSNRGIIRQQISADINKVYAFSAQITSTTANSNYVRVGQSVGSADRVSFTSSGVGTYDGYFVGGVSGTVWIEIGGVFGTGTTTVDNISVREINPLSVSIAMDGRVTYADTNFYQYLVYWQESSNNNIQIILDHRSSLTGAIQTQQKESGTASTLVTSNLLSEGINKPFDLAGRYTSTELNLAVDGVALTANTTPTALPDLSSIDLELGYTYMGTIGTFRVWDKDITDDGLVEATNPSLEPSLSLTFEGTGTNSFVVNDWSE